MFFNLVLRCLLTLKLLNSILQVEFYVNLNNLDQAQPYS